MRRTLSTLIPPLVSLALAAGLALQMGAFAAADDATAFHAAVREAIEAVPVRIGEFESREVKLPPAAGKLLRPNAWLSRQYQAPSGRWANLVVVHCSDSRDMSGHYPPNCYPGSGWTQLGPPVEHTLTCWGRSVPIAEYRFGRPDLDRTATSVVYDFFVLPAGGVVTRMEQVVKASGDYRTRPYGAAQIQVLLPLDKNTPDAERLSIVGQLLEPLGPVIDRLEIKSKGAR